jgi:hypothetical protein
VRRDAGQAVAEAARDLGGVVGEARHDVARQPAAIVVQRLRQVPVVERRMRLDAGGQQFVEQAVVEREAGLVPGALPSGCTRGQEKEKR